MPDFPDQFVSMVFEYLQSEHAQRPPLSQVERDHLIGFLVQRGIGHSNTVIMEPVYDPDKSDKKPHPPLTAVTLRDPENTAREITVPILEIRRLIGADHSVVLYNRLGIPPSASISEAGTLGPAAGKGTGTAETL